MRELAKGKINETKIQGIIERSITLQSRLERTLGESTLRLRKSMTPQEARDYFGRRAERMDRFIDRNQKDNLRRKPNE
jgi:flagellar biosynthesis/type III secretory pathway chaperone